MKVFTKKLSDKRGFTLIELVVVIAVIAILAAIAIPYFSGVSERANVATDEANYKMLHSVASLYVAENPGKAVTGGSEPDDLVALIQGKKIPVVKSKTTGEEGEVGEEFKIGITADGEVTIKPIPKSLRDGGDDEES